MSRGCAVQITLPAVHGFAAVRGVSGERCWFKRGRKMFSSSLPPCHCLGFLVGTPQLSPWGCISLLPSWVAQCCDANTEKDEGPDGICFFSVSFVSCRTLPSFPCPNSLISSLPSYHEDGKRFLSPVMGFPPFPSWTGRTGSPKTGGPATALSVAFGQGSMVTVLLTS